MALAELRFPYTGSPLYITDTYVIYANGAEPQANGFTEKDVTVGGISVPADAVVQSAYWALSFNSQTNNGTVRTDKAAGVSCEVSDGKLEYPASYATGQTSKTVNIGYSSRGTAGASKGTYQDRLSITSLEFVVVVKDDKQPCTPPTSATLLEKEVEPYKFTYLMWSGATGGGENNTIAGYQIQYKEDGSDEWITVATTGSDGDGANVRAGEAGTVRTFRIRTIGSAGGAYNSSWYVLSDTLTAIREVAPDTTAVAAPEDATLSTTAVDDGTDTVQISWTKPADGQNNPVAGYQIQAADAASDGVWSEWFDLSERTALNANVAVPAAGYYRKFRIRTMGQAGVSYYSGWYMIPGTVYHKVSSSDVPDAPADPDNSDTPMTVTSHENMPPYRAYYVWRRVK